MKYFARLFLVTTLMAGCAPLLHSSTKLNRLNIGMSKQDVLNVMGEPVSTSAANSLEYLTYNLHVSGHPRGQEYTPHFVRLKNGKVDSYGRIGDFDSTKSPETKTTIDLNINKE